MRFLVLSLFLLLTGCATPLIVTPDFATLTPEPTVTPEPTATTEPCLDAEAEFARGVYATCLKVLTYNGTYSLPVAISACRQMTEELLDQGLYEAELPGWVWPLSVTY